jgi:hypothetical protein
MNFPFCTLARGRARSAASIAMSDKFFSPDQIAIVETPFRARSIGHGIGRQMA